MKQCNIRRPTPKSTPVASPLWNYSWWVCRLLVSVYIPGMCQHDNSDQSESSSRSMILLPHQTHLASEWSFFYFVTLLSHWMKRSWTLVQLSISSNDSDQSKQVWVWIRPAKTNKPVSFSHLVRTKEVDHLVWKRPKKQNNFRSPWKTTFITITSKISQKETKVSNLKRQDESEY